MIEWLLFGLAQVGAFALGWISRKLQDRGHLITDAALASMREERDFWCELAKQRHATLTKAADEAFALGRKLNGNSAE